MVFNYFTAGRVWSIAVTQSVCLSVGCRLLSLFACIHFSTAWECLRNRYIRSSPNFVYILFVVVVFTAQCYASAVLAVGLCLCLFSDAKDLHEIRLGSPNHPPRGRRMQVGWVKISDFWQITGYISKTVQNKRMVSIKVKQEVVCDLSNGDIVDDLECPLTTPNHPIFCILHCHS